MNGRDRLATCHDRVKGEGYLELFIPVNTQYFTTGLQTVSFLG